MRNKFVTTQLSLIQLTFTSHRGQFELLVKRFLDLANCRAVLCPGLEDRVLQRAVVRERYAPRMIAALDDTVEVDKGVAAALAPAQEYDATQLVRHAFVQNANCPVGNFVVIDRRPAVFAWQNHTGFKDGAWQVDAESAHGVKQNLESMRHNPFTAVAVVRTVKQYLWFDNGHNAGILADTRIA